MSRSIFDQVPGLSAELMELAAANPDASTGALAMLLGQAHPDIAGVLSKDAVQKRLKAARQSAAAPSVAGTRSAVDLAAAVETARSNADPTGYQPRTIAITEVETVDNVARRVSVTYAARPAVERVAHAPVDYLRSLAPAPSSAERLVVCLGDTQFPYEDPRAWGLTLAWIRDVRPAWIVLTGDILDAASISRWETDPRIMGIQDELNYAHARLAELRAAAGPDARISWVPGNHEERLAKYVAATTPKLVGLRRPGEGHDVLSLPYLTAVDALGIEWVGTPDGALGGDYLNAVLRITPDLVATHGYFSRKGGGGASILPLVERWGESVVGGHDHSAGIGHVTRGGVAGSAVRVYSAISTGFLARRDLGYMPVGTSNWQLGFAVISVWGEGAGEWTPELVNIRDGGLTWRGRRWGTAA